MKRNRQPPSVAEKLQALKEGHELPVDLSILRPAGTHLDTDERAVLALARAFQHAEDPDYVSISWDCQVRASRFFNGHGLARTLERILELGGEL